MSVLDALIRHVLPPSSYLAAFLSITSSSERLYSPAEKCRKKNVIVTIDSSNSNYDNDAFQKIYCRDKIGYLFFFIYEGRDRIGNGWIVFKRPAEHIRGAEDISLLSPNESTNKQFYYVESRCKREIPGKIKISRTPFKFISEFRFSILSR